MHAAVLDIAPIALQRRPFAVILGQDLLHSVVADIDFPGHRVAFHDPARQRAPARRLRPRPMPGRAKFVPISLEGASVDVVLDTGASGALALSAALRRGRRSARRPRNQLGAEHYLRRLVTGPGRARPERQLRRSRDRGRARPHLHPGQGRPIPRGLFGVEVLERFRVIIDAGRGQLYLVPGPDRPGAHDQPPP